MGCDRPAFVVPRLWVPDSLATLGFRDDTERVAKTRRTCMTTPDDVVTISKSLL